MIQLVASSIDVSLPAIAMLSMYVVTVFCTAARTADGMRLMEDEPALFVHLHGPVPTGRVPVAGLAAVRRADEAAGMDK